MKKPKKSVSKSLKKQHTNTIQILWIVKNHVPNNRHNRFAAINKIAIVEGGLYSIGWSVGGNNCKLSIQNESGWLPFESRLATPSGSAVFRAKKRTGNGTIDAFGLAPLLSNRRIISSSALRLKYVTTNTLWFKTNTSSYALIAKNKV